MHAESSRRKYLLALAHMLFNVLCSLLYKWKETVNLQISERGLVTTDGNISGLISISLQAGEEHARIRTVHDPPVFLHHSVASDCGDCCCCDCTVIGGCRARVRARVHVWRERGDLSQLIDSLSRLIQCVVGSWETVGYL